MAKFFVGAVLLALGCADAASLRPRKSQKETTSDMPEFDEQCDDFSDPTPVDDMILAVNTTAGAIGDKAHETMMGAIAAVSDMKAGLVNESLEQVESVQDKLMAFALAGDDESTSLMEKMDKSFSKLGPQFSDSTDGACTSMQKSADLIDGMGASFIQQVGGLQSLWPWGGSSPSKEKVAQMALSKVNTTLLEFPSKVLDKMQVVLIEALNGTVQAAQGTLSKFQEGCNVVAESISDGELADTAIKIMEECSSATDTADSLEGMASSAADAVSKAIASIQAKVDTLLKTVEEMKTALDATVAEQEAEDSAPAVPTK